MKATMKLINGTAVTMKIDETITRIADAPKVKEGFKTLFQTYTPADIFSIMRETLYTDEELSRLPFSSEIIKMTLEGWANYDGTIGMAINALTDDGYDTLIKWRWYIRYNLEYLSIEVDTFNNAREMKPYCFNIGGSIGCEHLKRLREMR